MPCPPDRLVTIADALAVKGWYVGPSIFDHEQTLALAERARDLADSGALHAAKVGRAALTAHNDAVRTDETRWLDDAPSDATECMALEEVHALRAALNEALFFGAQSVELHFARYAAGAFYKTHLDRFRDDDLRMVSVVFYLNTAWPSDGGGELVLYGADGSGAVEARVAPTAGTMACFLSDRFPHEVLPAHRERYSLTGWMRRAPHSALMGKIR
jgi:SM-20-related protein